MSKDTDPVCLFCRFWHSRKHDDLGWCRRYAPRPVALDVETESFTREASFPVTSQDDWCEEFEKRKKGEHE